MLEGRESLICRREYCKRQWLFFLKRNICRLALRGRRQNEALSIQIRHTVACADQMNSEISALHSQIPFSISCIL